jgi:hypothetical protein
MSTDIHDETLSLLLRRSNNNALMKTTNIHRFCNLLTIFQAIKYNSDDISFLVMLIRDIIHFQLFYHF